MEVIGGMAKDPKASESVVPWPQSFIKSFVHNALRNCMSYCFNHVAKSWQLCAFLQEPTCHAGSLLLCLFSFPFSLFFPWWKNGGNTAAKENVLIANMAWASFVPSAAECCWYLFTLNKMEFFPMIKGYSGTTKQCQVGPFCLSVSFLFSLSPARDVELAAFQHISIPSLSLSSNTP